MKTSTFARSRSLSFSVIGLALSLGAGCASTGMNAQTTASAKWETVTLANGVELKVSEDAGPEARRVVEQIQSEMRSRYISAR